MAAAKQSGATHMNVSGADVQSMEEYLNGLLEGCTLVGIRRGIAMELEQERARCARWVRRSLEVGAQALPAPEEESRVAAGLCIEGAANVQISACSPNFLILESIQTWGGFHAEILKVPMRWEDGYVIPPTAPGLGVELDEEVAAAHPYDGDRLHLETLERPF